MLSVASMDSRLEDTIRLNEEALQAAGEAGDRPIGILAQATLAIFRWIAGDREVARDLADGALQAARPNRSPTLIALALYGRGYTLQDVDPVSAIEHLREGVELFRRTRSNTMTLLCLQLLSRLEAQHGDPAMRSKALTRQSTTATRLATGCIRVSVFDTARASSSE